MSLILSIIFLSSSATLQDQSITVTSDRPRRDPRGGIEAPYPETERIPLGSRIARRMPVRPFRTVATESGLAGLVGIREGGNWDGTGGSSASVRTRLATECVPEHQQVGEAVACILFRVGRSTEVGDHEAASQALAPLLVNRQLSGWERYYVGHFAFALADRMESDAGRAQGLAIMLDSGRMDASERLQALRTLATIALRGNDDATAIARLAEVAQVAPDPRTLANLAALHSRTGNYEQATVRMAQAVNLARQQGTTPPPEWVAFLSASN